MDAESEILTATIAGLEAWGQALRHLDAGDRSYWWARAFHSNNPAEQYREHGVPYRPTLWVESELDTAQRQALSRAVRSLSNLGLIVAVRQNGSRVSHIQPTPKGLQMAIKLVVQQGHMPDTKAVAIALRTSGWATDEHLAALEQMT